MKKFLACICLTLFLSAGLATLALAEENGWQDTAELSLVNTSGNSENTSFGFKNTATRTWDKAVLNIRAGGIKVDSTSKAAFLIDDGAGGISRPEFDETTAENYFLNSRFDREISETFFWYAGAGWDRNEFAGIENRYIGEGGVGNILRNDDDVKFRIGYGLTFTKQDDVFPVAGADDTFLGWRGSWDYLNKLNERTTYTNVLAIDGNLDESSDYRADMQNGLSVAMSDRLAIKLGLQLLYDHQPSVRDLEVLDITGASQVPAVFQAVEFDDLDTIFTASLVINF